MPRATTPSKCRLELKRQLDPPAEHSVILEMAGHSLATWRKMSRRIGAQPDRDEYMRFQRERQHLLKLLSMLGLKAAGKEAAADSEPDETGFDDLRG